MSKQFSQDQIQFINQEIEVMPTPEKTILQLKFWHNYTTEEIAFICDLSQTLIKKLLDEAIHRLRLNYLIEFSKPKEIHDREVECNELAT